jgi:hypothetical protein
VDQLKRWLAGRPEEWIPELKFMPETSWWKSAGWHHVTDDDYRGWMSALRSGAENKFARLASDALKQYAQANGGGFPARLVNVPWPKHGSSAVVSGLWIPGNGGYTFAGSG